MSHAFDAILFDMDGTLIDTEHLWLRTEFSVMNSYGAQWDESDQRACLGGPLDHLIDYMRERIPVPTDHETIRMQILSTMESNLRSGNLDWQLGAAELLIESADADLPRALVTASYRTLVDAALAGVMNSLQEQLGNRPPFHTTVAGDEVPESKPSPLPYLVAAHKLGLDPKRCVVIEDSKPGISAGLAAGAFVIAVPQLVTVEPAERLVVLPSLEGMTLIDIHRLVQRHS